MLNLRVRGIPAGSVSQVLWPAGPRMDRPLHVFFAICDHYEPRWPGHCSQIPDPNRPPPPRHIQDARVNRWVQEYPRAVDGLQDSVGRCPQHTFFYPGDEYDAEYIDRIGELCRQGYGDVDIHLHHDRDTSQELREKLEWFRDTLHNRHGLLRKDELGRIAYGFIHGNWALDNSRPDGHFCGVNDELTILRETGCYADFTLPSAPNHSQTSTVNSIYYAIDDPQRPCSHDRGISARVGREPPENGLLIIQGPLVFDLGSRKWGILPRLDNSDVAARRHPTIERFKLWLSAGVSVHGREDWVFIKVYTHGAQDPTMEMFLGPVMRRFHEDLRRFADGFANFKYYYVTAWEMAGLVHQAESGVTVPVFGDVGSNSDVHSPVSTSSGVL